MHGQSPGRSRTETPSGPLRMQSGHLPLLGTVYDSAPAVLSPRKAHLELGVQSFNWGSITYTWLTAHVTGLRLHPLKVKQIPCDAPPESYSWTIWWPSPPGKKHRYSYQARHSQGLVPPPSGQTGKTRPLRSRLNSLLHNVLCTKV